jgi:hypothetical protein
MQPVNLAVDAELDAGAAALEATVAAGLEADEAGVVLLPHAVASNAAAAQAATDNAVIRTDTSTGLGSPQCTTGAPLVRRELRPLEPARCEIAIHDRKYPVKFQTRARSPFVASEIQNRPIERTVAPPCP